MPTARPSIDKTASPAKWWVLRCDTRCLFVAVDRGDGFSVLAGVEPAPACSAARLPRAVRGRPSGREAQMGRSALPGDVGVEPAFDVGEDLEPDIRTWETGRRYGASEPAHEDVVGCVRGLPGPSAVRGVMFSAGAMGRPRRYNKPTPSTSPIHAPGESWARTARQLGRFRQRGNDSTHQSRLRSPTVSTMNSACAALKVGCEPLHAEQRDSGNQSLCVLRRLQHRSEQTSPPR